MNRWSRTSSLCIAVLVVLGATSCASSSQTASAPPGQGLIDAITNDIVFQEDALTSDPSEAECVGEGTYSLLGANRLAELGVTVASPNLQDVKTTAAEEQALADVVTGCVGAVKVLASESRTTTTTAPDTGITDRSSGAPAGVTQAEIDQMVADAMQGPDALTDDPTEARCLAHVLIGTFGVERLDELETLEKQGIDDSTPEEVAMLLDVMMECTDFRAQMVTDFSAPDVGLMPADATCIVQGFSDAEYRTIMLEGMTAGPLDDASPQVDGLFERAVTGCGLVWD